MGVFTNADSPCIPSPFDAHAEESMCNIFRGGLRHSRFDISRISAGRSQWERVLTLLRVIEEAEGGIKVN